jgi:hypothetical protein
MDPASRVHPGTRFDVASARCPYNGAVSSHQAPGHPCKPLILKDGANRPVVGDRRSGSRWIRGCRAMKKKKKQEVKT